MIDKIKEAVDQEKIPQKKLPKFLVARLSNIANLPSLYSVLKDEGIEHHSFVLELRQKHQERELKIVRDILKEGVEKGIFRGKTNFEIILKGVMVAFSGLEFLLGKDRDIAESEKDVNEAMDLVFHGILSK